MRQISATCKRHMSELLGAKKEGIRTGQGQTGQEPAFWHTCVQVEQPSPQSLTPETARAPGHMEDWWCQKPTFGLLKSNQSAHF
jgi:hypothetical protein